MLMSALETSSAREAGKAAGFDDDDDGFCSLNLGGGGGAKARPGRRWGCGVEV